MSRRCLFNLPNVSPVEKKNDFSSFVFSLLPRTRKMLAAWPFLGMVLFCFIISDSHGFFCFPEMAHTRFSKNSCANGANRLTKRPRQNLQLCVGPALIFHIEKWEKKTKLTWIRIFFPSCELSYGRRKCRAPKMDDAWLASDIGQPGPLHSSNSSQLGRDFNLTTVHPLFESIHWFCGRFNIQIHWNDFVTGQMRSEIKSFPSLELSTFPPAETF